MHICILGVAAFQMGQRRQSVDVEGWSNGDTIQGRECVNICSPGLWPNSHLYPHRRIPAHRPFSPAPS
ncbi:hypothetical protein BDZ89DRAFT_809541 [Hymenopellis radicata]|nr:hypothetical protein BDZ89DRAFT_809541 [Hymenopellis radicata]